MSSIRRARREIIVNGDCDDAGAEEPIRSWFWIRAFKTKTALLTTISGVCSVVIRVRQVTMTYHVCS